MKIVYLVHGYPPREKAGTEQHCALLVQGMTLRGHQILVIAATRAIGRKHGEIIREGNIVRIVNNIPSRPLKQAEKEDSIHHIIQKELSIFQPDIIHIEHTQFLSSSLIFKVPTILTLHDAWFWCPAGGTLLRNGLTLCQDPTPEDCLSCSANWRPIPTKTASLLGRIAGKLHPIIPSPKLHSLWQKLPHRLRSRVSRQEKASEIETPRDLQKRNQQFLRLANHCQIITAPSQFLADQAEKQGMESVLHISNGAEETREHLGGSGFVFLGTMEKHKGPDIVEKAYLLAFPAQNQDDAPPIHFYGNGSLSVSLPHSPAVPRQKVFEILQSADCLVLGSIWPENAPMIILEARACGCPIIAPDIGGIPELILNGVDGFLYAVGDVSQLAQKMKKSLTWNFSPRRPPAQNEILDQYEQLYREISP